MSLLSKYFGKNKDGIANGINYAFKVGVDDPPLILLLKSSDFKNVENKIEFLKLYLSVSERSNALIKIGSLNTAIKYLHDTNNYGNDKMKQVIEDYIVRNNIKVNNNALKMLDGMKDFGIKMWQSYLDS